MWQQRFVAALAAGLVSFGAVARAEPLSDAEPTTSPPPPRHRWVWDSLVAARLNPRGAIVRVRTGYQMRFWDRPGILFEDSFGSVKLAADLTPAYTRLGGIVEWQPLAVLRLWARYDFLASHGEFSYTQSFTHPRAEYSDSATEARSALNYATTGDQMTLGALARVKYGSVVLRTQLEAISARLALAERDTVFYEGYLDSLFPNGGWGLGSDTDLIYLFDSGFKLALRYTVNHVIYRPHDDATNALAAPVENINTPTHRFGPAVLYTFFEDPPGALYNAPTLALLAQWWLKHRFRTGQDTHAAMPYMLLVLLQHGDFLTK